MYVQDSLSHSLELVNAGKYYQFTDWTKYGFVTTVEKHEEHEN
jgi:hypothetical protein